MNNKILLIWRSYSIVYAIGYMLIIRPTVTNKFYDVIFYASLIGMATWNYLSLNKQNK